MKIKTSERKENTSGWKSRATHVEESVKDVKRVYVDKSWRRSWCAVNKMTWSPQRNQYVTSCLCLLHHPAPKSFGGFIAVVNASEQRTSRCIVHVWNENSGESPERDMSEIGLSRLDDHLKRFTAQFFCHSPIQTHIHTGLLLASLLSMRRAKPSVVLAQGHFGRRGKTGIKTQILWFADKLLVYRRPLGLTLQDVPFPLVSPIHGCLL